MGENITQLNMQDEIYLPSGYVNMGLSYDSPFCAWIGARGIGKTYGAIENELEAGRTFLLLRKSQTQSDIIAKPEFSPLRPNLEARGAMYKRVALAKQISGYYYCDADDEIIDPHPICYTAALSTFSNLRGFSGADIKTIIYDEFVGEPTEKPLKHEYQALMNCYETINRNRELQGQPPVNLIMTANSFDIANNIFMGLSIVNDVYQMYVDNISVKKWPERGLQVFLPTKSPISKRKADTVLYRLNRGSDFEKMALENSFIYDYPEKLGKRPLGEYKVLCKIGELSVCAHKSKNEYYATCQKTGGCNSIFTTDDRDLERAKIAFPFFRMFHMARKVTFCDYVSQILYEKFFC